MSLPAMGAVVQYCGHEGSFIADIFVVENVNVVKANGPVNPGNLLRGEDHKPTHIVSDCPKRGCWAPERGIFVVPLDQCRDLGYRDEARPQKCHHIWIPEGAAQINVEKNLKVLTHRCPHCGKVKQTKRLLDSRVPKHV